MPDYKWNANLKPDVAEFPQNKPNTHQPLRQAVKSNTIGKTVNLSAQSRINLTTLSIVCHQVELLIKIGTVWHTVSIFSSKTWNNLKRSTRSTGTYVLYFKLPVSLIYSCGKSNFLSAPIILSKYCAVGSIWLT